MTEDETTSRKESGFTLIELAIALLIIGLGISWALAGWTLMQ